MEQLSALRLVFCLRGSLAAWFCCLRVVVVFRVSASCMGVREHDRTRVCFSGSGRRVWVFVNTTEHVFVSPDQDVCMGVREHDRTRVCFSGSGCRVWVFVNTTEHGLF